VLPDSSAANVYEFLIGYAIAQEGLRQIDNEPITLNIMDFGCGDGRHLELYTILAKVFKHYNVHLNFCGYDISPKGLEIYGQKSVQKFGFVPDAKSPTRFYGDNISLKLVCSKNPDADPYIQKARIIAAMQDKSGWGKTIIRGTKTQPVFDVTLVLFGSLAYIIDEDKRAKTIKTLFDMTRTSLLVNVPTAKFIDDGFATIVEKRFDEGVILYQAGDAVLPYAIFEGSGTKRPLGVRPASLKQEMLDATSIEIGQFGFTTMNIRELPTQFGRPGVASQSLEAYVSEFELSVIPDRMDRDPTYIFEDLNPDRIRAAQAREVRGVLNGNNKILRQKSGGAFIG